MYKRQIEKVGFKTVLAPGYSVHVIDEQVEARMREFLDVAPAHNGPYLEAVSHFRKLLPDAVLVGAFETAFHETIPLERKFMQFLMSGMKNTVFSAWVTTERPTVMFQKPLS